MLHIRLPRRFYSCAALLLVIAVATSACGTNFDLKIDDAVQSDAAIGALTRDAQDALNSADPAAFVSLFDDYFIYLPADGPAVTDRDSLLALTEARMRDRRWEVMIIQEDLLANEDLAIAHHEIRGHTIGLAAGDTVNINRKELVVYRQTPDGWRIARLMANEND